MKNYRKKPVVIQAEQWWDLSCVPEAEIIEWNQEPSNGTKKCMECGYQMKDHGFCPTLEGAHIVCPGDWIIRGVRGEYYPCKPDIFEETYEEA